MNDVWKLSPLVIGLVIVLSLLVLFIACGYLFSRLFCATATPTVYTQTIVAEEMREEEPPPERLPLVHSNPDEKVNGQQQ